MKDPAKILEALGLAGSQREMAAHLLRVPDTLVLQIGAQLQLLCIDKSFAAGAAFIELRLSGLASERDAHGLLPNWIGIELELWRHVLSRFAAGEGVSLPAFMRTPG